MPHRIGPPLLGHPHVHAQGDARPDGHFADGAGRRAGAAVHGPGHHAAVDHRLADEERLSASVHEAGRERGVLCAAQRPGHRRAGQYAGLLPAPPGPAELRSRLRGDQQTGRRDDHGLLVAWAWTTPSAIPAGCSGYWHGIVVAGGVDNLCGTPFCQTRAGPCAQEEAGHHHLRASFSGRLGRQADQLRLGLDEHARGPLGRTGRHGLGAIRSSPGRKRGSRMQGGTSACCCETEFAPDGTHISCPHYIGAASTSFYAWIALANSGLAEDVSTAPALQAIRPLLHAADEAHRPALGHPRALERGRYAARQFVAAGDPRAALQADRPATGRRTDAAVDRRRPRSVGRHGHSRRAGHRSEHSAASA